MNSSNSYDFALSAILRKMGDTLACQRLGILFRNEDSLEKLGFSLLHRTVLGLSELDLGQLIRSVSSATINQPDAKGRTALWWAARRGDLAATSLLVKAHADINQMDHDGTRPLNAAVRSENEPCAWLLLEMDNIECRFKADDGWTALHSCCYIGSSAPLMERLILGGADIDQVHENGGTALHFAVQESHNHLVPILISHGVNADAISSDGEHALSLAIEFRNNEALRLLLAHNTNHLQTIHVDETLLHYAAKHADVEGLRILRSFGLHGIDIHARTIGFGEYHDDECRGYTALEIALQRDDVGPEWLEMFEQLVSETEDSNGGTGLGDHLEVSEVFEDALEHQTLN